MEAPTAKPAAKPAAPSPIEIITTALKAAGITAEVRSSAGVHDQVLTVIISNPIKVS